MPRLILDVMGGDHAPRSNLDGILQALPELVGELILVGDEAVIKPLLTRRRYRAIAQALAEGKSRARCHVSLIHADENIEMDDSIKAVRSKPRATINVGCKMAAQDWDQWKKDGTSEPSAFISAGHSGAMMASALMHMGRLEGVERPAIAVKLPSLSPDGCVVLDVGANVDCKPSHFRDFAVMGTLFAQAERTSTAPIRVGVLANGEERSKGNELTREAANLIEKTSCFIQGNPAFAGLFVGYAEGKEIFKGSVDVVVTDGFVGNVVLKSAEGLGSAVVSLLKAEAKRSPLTAIGFLLASGAFRRLKKKLDYAEYGAAPLLGVAGYAFICHGRSNAKAMKNALLRTQTALLSRLVERLEKALSAATIVAPDNVVDPVKTGN